jgi:transcriptional regulator with XRE-family HTH domain
MSFQHVKDPVLRGACQAAQDIVRELSRSKAERGVSNTDLAAALMVRPNTVGALLAGESWPSTATLMGACAVLRVELSPTSEPFSNG